MWRRYRGSGIALSGRWRGAREGTEARDEKRLRIAVVPVEELSGKEGDYFAAGLTEDMISALSRIDPARLRVTAVPKIDSGDGMADHLDRLRRELNLDYLLRGSVRRSGDTLRISAQLHDLRDRSVLWSETFDRKAYDLLAVQEEVTQRVSESLALELFPSATVGTRRYSTLLSGLRRLSQRAFFLAQDDGRSDPAEHGATSTRRWPSMAGLRRLTRDLPIATRKWDRFALDR